MISEEFSMIFRGMYGRFAPTQIAFENELVKVISVCQILTTRVPRVPGGPWDRVRVERNRLLRTPPSNQGSPRLTRVVSLYFLWCELGFYWFACRN